MPPWRASSARRAARTEPWPSRRTSASSPVRTSSPTACTAPPRRGAARRRSRPAPARNRATHPRLRTTKERRGHEKALRQEAEPEPGDPSLPDERHRRRLRRGDRRRGQEPQHPGVYQRHLRLRVLHHPAQQLPPVDADLLHLRVVARLRPARILWAHPSQRLRGAQRYTTAGREGARRKRLSPAGKCGMIGEWNSSSRRELESMTRTVWATAVLIALAGRAAEAATFTASNTDHTGPGPRLARRTGANGAAGRPAGQVPGRSAAA